MDMGSHMFDLLIGLFGLPTSVFAQCETWANDYEVEDSATIAMTMAGMVLSQPEIVTRASNM